MLISRCRSLLEVMDSDILVRATLLFQVEREMMTQECQEGQNMNHIQLKITHASVSEFRCAGDTYLLASDIVSCHFGILCSIQRHVQQQIG